MSCSLQILIWKRSLSYFHILKQFCFHWCMRQEEKRDKCQVNLSSEHRYIISIKRARLPPRKFIFSFLHIFFFIENGTLSNLSNKCSIKIFLKLKLFSLGAFLDCCQHTRQVNLLRCMNELNMGWTQAWVYPILGLYSRYGKMERFWGHFKVESMPKLEFQKARRLWSFIAN